jgi:hypothetical protein
VEIPKMKRALCALATALTLAAAASGAHADPLFDRGVALAALAESLVAAESAGDVAGVMSLYVPGDGIAAYDGRDAHLGRDAVEEAVAARVVSLPKREFVVTAPRVLVGASTGWIFLEWEWGVESGRHVARARREGGSWLLDALDFDGASADAPIDGFDASDASAAIDGPTRMMEKGAAAFAANDQAGQLAVIVEDLEDFVFIDADGDRWEGVLALGWASFAEPPEELSRDAMTLFVGAGLGRAIAFQVVAGQRTSLLMERRGGWRVVEASMSVPLDVLPVAPDGKLATTWGSLRLGVR